MNNLSQKDSTNPCPVHWLVVAVAAVGIVLAQYLGADLLNHPLYLGALAFALVIGGLVFGDRPSEVLVDQVVSKEAIEAVKLPTVQAKPEPVETRSVVAR